MDAILLFPRGRTRQPGLEMPSILEGCRHDAYSGTEESYLTGEDKALHNVMTASALVFIVMAMLLFGILASPSLSPIAAIADWDGDGLKNNEDDFPRDPDESVDSDGDGVGDNGDAFPYDPSETEDSDDDGFGDNEDTFDQGDAVLKISLEKFEFIDYVDDHVQTSYYPNAWFVVLVDLDGDEDYDATYESVVFNATKSLTDFYTVSVDIDDDLQWVSFMVIAYDVTLVSTNNVTDLEIIDYNPAPGLRTLEQTVGLPCDLTWASDGDGDDDTPDCYLEYSAQTVENT